MSIGSVAMAANSYRYSVMLLKKKTQRRRYCACSDNVGNTLLSTAGYEPKTNLVKSVQGGTAASWSHTTYSLPKSRHSKMAVVVIEKWTRITNTDGKMTAKDLETHCSNDTCTSRSCASCYILLLNQN